MQVYLSQVVGRPVLDRHGEPIGRVADLIVAIGDRYPPVTGPS
jgi:sporulation protein YlmC with PRC-barrel domain